MCGYIKTRNIIFPIWQNAYSIYLGSCKIYICDLQAKSYRKYNGECLWQKRPLHTIQLINHSSSYPKWSWHSPSGDSVKGLSAFILFLQLFGMTTNKVGKRHNILKPQNNVPTKLLSSKQIYLVKLEVANIVTLYTNSCLDFHTPANLARLLVSRSVTVLGCGWLKLQFVNG